MKFIHGQLSMRNVQDEQPMDERFSRTHSNSDASDDLEDGMYDSGRPWLESEHDILTNSNLSVERGDRAFWKQLLQWEPPSVDIVSESDGDESRGTDLDELHKTIFEGHVDVSLPPKKNNVCIMLASTITDYSEERDLLFNDVLPYLQRFGAKFGINVEISEMRLGLEAEANRDYRIVDTCLDEVQRCREESIGISFCLMLGDRYGYCPPPRKLTTDEYDRAISEGDDQIIELVNKYYYLDENLIPPAYVTEHSHEEEIIANFFGTPSVTELMAVAGILGEEARNSIAANNALVYERNFQNTTDVAFSLYCDTNDDNRKDKLENLKRASWRVVEEDQGHYRRFEVTSPDSEVMDIRRAVLARQKEDSMLSRISTGGTKDQYHATLNEISLHHAHAQSRYNMFVGREEIVGKLVDHCFSGKGALVLTGGSGTGKTSVLSEVARKLDEAINATTFHSDDSITSDLSGSQVSSRSSKKKPVILVRFLGISPASTTSESVAESLIHQLSLAYPHIVSEYSMGDDHVTLRPPEKLLHLLRNLSSRDERIVLILDSIDQLDKADPGRLDLKTWLPPLVGFGTLKNVVLLISTLPNECIKPIQALPNIQIEEIPPLTLDEGSSLLDALCQKYSRELRSAQRDMILEAFESEGKTALYLTIAVTQSIRWRSWDESLVVAPTVNEQIKTLFEQLRQDLGKELVKFMASYMTLIPGGVSVDEIRRIALVDELVTNEVFKFNETPGNRMPPLLLARARERLAPYLVERNIDGEQTFNWCHQQLREAAEKEFLNDPEYRKQVHTHAYQMFSKQPDRHGPGHINDRKLHQVPYHLSKIENWSEFGYFLASTSEALLTETSQAGQARYASYWKLSQEKEQMFDIDQFAPNFVEKDSTTETIFLVGDFLKEYFDLYQVALDIYKLALDPTYPSDTLFDKGTRISDQQELDCMNRIGDTYTRMSKYAEALKWLEKSHAELHTNLGPSHGSTLRALTLLSRLAKESGRHEEALEFDTTLYDVSVSKFGPTDEFVADAARQLAKSHYVGGRYKKAIGYYEQNFTIIRQLYGFRHPNTADAMNSLGVSNTVLGNYAQGIRFCEQAYDVKESLYGINHSDTAVTIDSLASLYHLNGIHDKAMQLYNQAWDIKKKTLGRTHPDTIKMYGQIGRLYHDQGDYEKALTRLLENLRLREKILPLDHPQIAVAKNSLAALYVDMSEYEKAKVLAQESLDLRIRLLGEEHPYTAFSHDTLARALLALGSMNEAKDHALVSYRIRQRMLGLRHPRMAIAYMTLARVKSAQDDGEHAELNACKAKAVCVDSLPKDHPLLDESEKLLKQMLIKHGDLRKNITEKHYWRSSKSFLVTDED
eukprot:scaffold92310_cov59-Attheya_sp.AAC.3